MRTTEQRGHREQHPRQRPPHVRRPDRAKTQDPVIEIATAVPHAVHSPLENRTCQGNIVRAQILKLDECNDALRNTVDIDGIGTVMEIADRAILTEKVRSIKIE